MSVPFTLVAPAASVVLGTWQGLIKVTWIWAGTFDWWPQAWLKLYVAL